MFTIYCF